MEKNSANLFTNFIQQTLDNGSRRQLQARLTSVTKFNSNMTSGKRTGKATKKFEKKHLGGVLDKRKANAKLKQRYQANDQKKTKRTRDADYYKESKEEEAGSAAPAKNGFKSKGGKNVNDMSVDDFFQGGFDEIINEKGNASQPAKPGKKRKRNEQPAEAENGELDSDPDSASDEPMLDEDSVNEEDEESGDDAGMTQKTMDELAQKDPEFYQFLKENDPEALDFNDEADLAEVDDLSAEDSNTEDGPEKKKKKKKEKSKKKSGATRDSDEEEMTNALTRQQIASWKTSMAETHSLRAARQVVLAFRCAARLNEVDEDNMEDQRWIIDSPEVFNDILVLALKEIPTVLNHHLPIKESGSGRVYVQTESPKFKTMTQLLKSYTSSIMHLLHTLSDDKTLKMTLSSLTPILPYLLSFKKLTRALAKSVVNFWAQPASSETIRVTAFLVLRRLVVIGDKGIRETVLKAVYQGLVQGCRVTNSNTLSGINLMKNSAAELWGIDQGVGYTTAFTFIRQLAIHLRNSIVHNKNDAYRIVYNWQYTHSLDFWSCVLAEHCSPVKEAEAGKESQLRLLIYPLVQVTLGAMRLIPTSTYFPLRFHLVRSLLRTSRATGTYIPLASTLLEVLTSAELKKPPKASTLKAFDFAVAYKTPKSYLRTRVYQDGVGEQTIELMGEYFLLWATSIALPELVLPMVIQLKRWIKQARSKSQGNKNSKIISQLVLLVQKLEANAKFIEEKRAKVDFAPRDRVQVDAFLRDFDIAKTPLGAYIFAQRIVRAEKAKILDDARKEDEKKRKEEDDEVGDNVEDDWAADGSENDEDVDITGVDDDEELGSAGEADEDDE